MNNNIIGYINTVLFLILTGMYNESEPEYILLSVTVGLNIYHLMSGGYKNNKTKKDGKL